MAPPTRRDFLREAVGSAVAMTAGAAGAESAVERYAAIVSATPGLRGYWRFEGDLRDAAKTVEGQARGGEVQYADGVAGGRGLHLLRGRFVTMGAAKHIDANETTVELFFRVTQRPQARYNPCLVAKRLSSKQTRFSLHIWRDLSQLALWNGRRVSLVALPDGPLKVGRWRHVAVVSSRRKLQVYVDGVKCEVASGAPFTVSAKGLPLQVGASSPEGDEQCVCDIDELAIYGRALSGDEIAAHVDAIGWSARRRGLEQERQRRLEEQKRRQAEMLEQRLQDPRLLDEGQTRIYEGASLGAVLLPLGGIGAGVLHRAGTGELAAWQVFNNFEFAAVPHSFFAIAVQPDSGQRRVRALQGTSVGPFEGVPGIQFRGEYPFGWHTFNDSALPVQVEMESFNPLIPLNSKDSSIPCAVFHCRVTNIANEPVTACIVQSQQNAVGFTGDGAIKERAHKGYGGNRNRVLQREQTTLLHMTSDAPADGRHHGDMVVAVIGGNQTATASWASLESLYDALMTDGALDGVDTAGPSPAGETLDGAVGTQLQLQAGESATLTFVLSWHFPNARHGGGAWSFSGNQYANWWPNALAVAEYVVSELQRLTGDTRLYHDTLYRSNLPHYLLDRISSQVAVLRSKTCFWAQDGYFGGWEGCRPEQGCCAGNCGHVWHYAQAHAWLFPDIARRMREQVLRHQREDGGLPFRQPSGGVACDAQCGEVLEAYREHRLTTSNDWLSAQWPRIQRAMEFAIRQWDGDEDGVLAGPQHNTLDGECGGSTSWLGSMYLAALAAAEEMAGLTGDAKAARRYAGIRGKGAVTQNESLWNGEYYIQVPDEEPRQDYNNGCHIDQVLGQWWARMMDLPEPYPSDRVATALRSLLRYNFRGDFHGVPQRPRKFVDDNDAGMQMITWPHGDRPAHHMRYADEVMSGFEYSAAGAMVQSGLLREGLVVMLAAADRYDGRLRRGLSGPPGGAWGYSGNPFGDDECGKFYARAMSSWSLLLACQGFVYDGPRQRIGFRPVWRPEDHASFFPAAEGWGVYTQTETGGRLSAQMEVVHGRVPVAEFVLAPIPGDRLRNVSVSVDGRQVSATADSNERETRIALASPVVVEAGQSLVITVG